MAPRRSFTVDPVLTAVAIAYRNQAQMLIADDVLPRQDVAQERFGWTSYPLAEAFTVPETRVGRTGKVNEVEFSGKEETSEVEDHGLDAPVVNSDVAAAAAARAAGRSIYDPEARAVEGLTDLVTLAREVRVAAVVQDDNNYAAARRVTLAGGDQLDDYEASDPIETIQTGIDGTLIYRPNTCVMGSVVWSKLRRHPHLVNAIKGNLTEKGMISREQFCELFEIPRLLVGEGYVNLSQKGQAANLARVWGKNIALLHINPAATPGQGITWGMTAQFGTRIAGRIEDPDLGLEGGYRVRAGERVKELMIAKDVGYLIKNAVA
ncbi:capsid protein [Ancylobacter dichloromethanicus]|uniref:capsid protein n=1 Tax=Ancylobacter dichloromethanicus TaxID=518825 RepID=UPI003618EA42